MRLKQGFRRVEDSRPKKRQLLRDRSGVAAVEFAMILPLFVGLGLVGVEVAYMATVNMQVSQVALSLADNASRLGQTDNSAVTPTVSETDIDAIVSGALRQGTSFKLADNGRVILSSLEYDSDSDRQVIRWQRCGGTLQRNSSYGGDMEDGGEAQKRITGVGHSDTQIQAENGSAVMVAEVYYAYQGLFKNLLSYEPVFRQEAIFTIRDDRNLEPGVTGNGGTSQCA